jgi:hypothetical protein
MESSGGKPVLGSPKSAEQLLDMYFLDIRCALLEAASAFDRIERSQGGEEIFEDPRLKHLKQACDIIKNGRKNRAEQFLTLLSDLA